MAGFSQCGSPSRQDVVGERRRDQPVRPQPRRGNGPALERVDRLCSPTPATVRGRLSLSRDGEELRGGLQTSEQVHDRISLVVAASEYIRRGAMMPDDVGSVTRWIGGLKTGDEARSEERRGGKECA